MKNEPSEVFLRAFHKVLDRRLYLSEDMTEKILRKAAKGGEVVESPIDTLSDQELEAFQLMSYGYTTSEIARSLCLSPTTIGTYRARIGKSWDSVLKNCASMLLCGRKNN